MATIEQAEKLLQYADVSYEEARDALNACGGSLLDAIVFLERQGKVTSRGGSRNGSVTVLPGNAQEHKSYNRPAGESFADALGRFLKKVGELFDGMCENIAEALDKKRDGGHNAGETYQSGESEKL